MDSKIDTDILPVRGAWVSDPVKKAFGKVVAQDITDAMPSVRVRWMQPRQPDSWMPVASLRSGLRLHMEVHHCPPEATTHLRSSGIVVDCRTLGGRDQALVDFPDDGVRLWLPFQHLKQVRSVVQQFVTGNHDKRDTADRFRLRCLAHALELWNENTGSMSHLDIDPLPHQIHLVHKILASGNLNWMIADDVGLGKTIEVGMLLAALKRRGAFRRVLIVTPPGVMLQWQEELHHKFGMDEFVIYGRDIEIREPRQWKLYDHVIASIDRLKQSPHLESLLQADAWDLIIFDEAHRLSRRTYGRKHDSSQRFELAAKLRARTDAILLLTATPHQGMHDKFQALLELLRPERKPQIRLLTMHSEILKDMIIRNNKADVTDANGQFIFKGKTTRAIAVDVSEPSRAFDRALQDYLRRGYSAGAERGQQGRAIGFVMTVYRKLAASSVAAIYEALKRRRERLVKGHESDSDAVPAPEDYFERQEYDERFEGEFAAQAAERSQSVAEGRDEFFEGELELLDALIHQAALLLGEDIKLNRFLDELVAIVQSQYEGEKILIFTEYRATQAYLREALEERFGNHTVELIHGGQDHEERRAAIRRFEDQAQFLISTEAGGEGINLHRRCRLMVNYDLPWNPMRLVQRIGRLYRYGQQQRVVVFNMHAPHTIDAQVVQMMYERIAQVVADLAPFGSEFNERLEDDILGDIAELADLDVAQILEQAATTEVHRTADRINEALQRAKDAAAKQRELFEYVGGYDPNDTRGELRISAEHLLAFVEGMLSLNNIEIRRQRNAGRVWDLRLPEDLASKLPFGRRTLQVTLDRSIAAERSDVHMLDMDSPLMVFLLGQAKRVDFGGRVARLSGYAGDALLAGVLRWQNNHGVRMRQELTVVHVSGDGHTTLNDADFCRWLLVPAQDGDAILARPEAEFCLRAGDAATDERLRHISSADLHPENRQWVAAAWLA